jgi:hypothetical protein
MYSLHDVVKARRTGTKDNRLPSDVRLLGIRPIL